MLLQHISILSQIFQPYLLSSLLLQHYLFVITMPRPSSNSTIDDIVNAMESQARSTSLRNAFARGFIDEPDFNYMTTHPDANLSSCSNCNQPFLHLSKHYALSHMCRPTGEDALLSTYVTIPGHETTAPPPIEEAAPTLRKSNRASRPTAKRMAAIEDQQEREDAKRSKFLETLGDDCSLSQGYCSDPDDFAGWSDDDDDDYAMARTQDDISIHSFSSDTSDDFLQAGYMSVSTSSELDATPSLATGAAQHMKHVPPGNSNGIDTKDTDLLGSSVPAHAVDDYFDYPLLTHYETASLELREVLSKGGANLSTYNEIIKLIKKHNHPTEGAFGPGYSHHLPNREALLQRVRKRFPTAKPYVKNVPTVDNGKASSTPCIVFENIRQLKELLLDEDIMGDMSNLALDPSNPFDTSAVSPNEIGSEVMASYWFMGTFDMMVGVPDGKTMVIPLLIYLDKTGVDRMQRYGLEPVLYTLGIFTQKARRQRKFWRCMGYVPDFDSHTSSAKKAKLRNRKATKSERVRNYHDCLRAILQEFIDVQTHGIRTWVRIGQDLRYQTIFLPVSNVIGDGKSSDYINCLKGGGGLMKPTVSPETISTDSNETVV